MEFWYISIGPRNVPVDSCAYWIHMLRSKQENNEVLNTRRYPAKILREQLFSSPGIVHQISLVSNALNIEDQSQKEDILEFFEWLIIRFIPFLEYVQGVIPNVFEEIEIYLKDGRLSLTLTETIMRLLQNHTYHPLYMIRAIAFQLISPQPASHFGFSWNNKMVKLAMAELHCQNVFMFNHSMAQQSGLLIEEVIMQRLDMKFFLKKKVRCFKRKLLTITASCRFVIDRLGMLQDFRGLCLKRVCSNFVCLNPETEE